MRLLKIISKTNVREISIVNKRIETFVSDVVGDVGQLPDEVLRHARNATALGSVIAERTAGYMVQDLGTGQYVGLIHGTPRQLSSCLSPNEELLSVVYPNRDVALAVPEVNMLIQIRNLANTCIDSALDRDRVYGIDRPDSHLMGW